MKKKNIAEQFAENIFNSPQFREKWHGYLAVFGSEIADLFPDSYKTKVGFAAILQKICDKNFDDARRDLTAYLDSAYTDREKNIISRLIGLCAENISEPSYPKKSEKYMLYRDILLKKRFSEAAKRHGNFFRRTTYDIAFVINLYDEEDGVAVVYGLASTAAMTGCENWFSDNGSDGESCQFRNIIRIRSDGDESAAAETILNFYNRYNAYPKNWILNIKKERQKAFLGHFARALKPLGFKKKGTRWTKNLDEENALSFEAQKSAFSDQYYFNVSIHSPSDFYARSSYERVIMKGRDIYNWQLMSEKEIDELIEYSISNYIKPKLK